jgi:hypothetical protein
LPFAYPQIQPLVPFRLAPGEFVEAIASNIGVGPNDRPKYWQSHNVSLWLEAKDGDEVTFIPEHIVGDPFFGRTLWWPGYISSRLNLEQPLPMDEEVRRRILSQVSPDLFGSGSGEEEYALFLADREPNALESLAKRPGITSSSGTLISGPTKFTVLPADSNAAN